MYQWNRLNLAEISASTLPPPHHHDENEADNFESTKNVSKFWKEIFLTRTKRRSFFFEIRSAIMSWVITSERAAEDEEEEKNIVKYFLWTSLT